MRRIPLAILTVLLALLSQVATAQPAPLTPDCRYLFIVDTSLSMTRLQESTATSISRMVETGLDGQMTPGEVFTIWTFNEDVQQHEFPLTSWSPERGEAMSSRVGEFLRSRRFRRTSNMRSFINAVYEAKRSCPRLAVFLISNGEEVIVGTPFDRNINVSYGRRFEELRSTRVPFLTVLMCQNGEIVSWAAQAANETVDLPGGPDGKPVVGRRRQPFNSNPAPVPSETIPRALGPVTNTLTLMPLPETTATPPAKEVSTPSIAEKPAAPAPPTRPSRTVVNLSSPVDPDAPRVVDPTDVAPQPKPELPKLPFTKPKPIVAEVPGTETNTPAPTKISPVADPPVEIEDDAPNQVTNKIAVVIDKPVTPPPVNASTNAAKPLISLSSTNPPAKIRRSPDIVLAATSPAAPASTSNATAAAQPVTRVIIVTQVVNVAWPQKPIPAPVPKPPAPEPSPATNAAPVTVKSNAPPTAAVEPVPQVASPDTVTNASSAAPATFAQTNKRPSFVTSPSTQFTAKPASPREPATESPSPSTSPSGDATLAATEKGLPKQWVYLGTAIALLVLAGLLGRQLMSPPLDASLISQSMDDRDNG
ncbi:MAG: hypothetical protein ISQ14_03365 [Verrucomicrobiae bacterium]|nr:hypothetical protein [Verrucomicrobiae bacterium]